MAKEISVYLYPAQGGGVQVMRTPQGDMPIPIPHLQYVGVQGYPEKSWSKGHRVLTFTNRVGETVETDLPYVIVTGNKPEGDA